MDKRVRPEDDDGFVLLESIIAIGLISVIMAALAPFFVNSLALLGQQRARQVAAQIANSSIETIRGLPASDLVPGHYADAVPPVPAPPSASVVGSWITSMPALVTGTALSAAVDDPTVNNVVYGVDIYLESCVIQATSPPTPTTSSTACGPGAASSGVSYLRAVVALAWANQRVPSSPHNYVTATLLSPDGDPTFNPQQVPAAWPVVHNPGDQVSTVGATVALQLATEPNTGVPAFSWFLTGGGLPAGLAMNPAGLISGSPTVVTPPMSVSVNVTDSLFRTAVSDATFTWTVVAAPTIVTPADQISTVNTPVSLSVVSTCPNTPCTFTMTNAPVGLTIDNTGVISGTPTVAGTRAVTVTVTDKDGVSATTNPFIWTVLVPLSVCIPSLALPNGSFEAPGGLAGPSYPNNPFGGTSPLLWDTTEPDNQIELWGNGAASQSANGGLPILAQEGTQWAELNANQTGALYQNLATAPGEILQWSVWHRARYAGNSTGQDVMQVQIGSTTSQTPQVPTGQITAMISDGPLSWVRYTGVYTVPAGQATTRFQFAAISTSSGSNSVGNFIDHLSLNNNVACLTDAVTDQTSTVDTAIVPLRIAIDRGTGPFVWGGGATLPAGLVISADGLITGTPTVLGTRRVVLTLMDATLFQQTVTFNWTVLPRPSITAPADQTSTVGADVELRVASSCPNRPCTFALSDGPPGLSIDGSGLISGTITGPARTFNKVTVTVTDSAGAQATGAFTWTVTDAPSVAAPEDQTTTNNTAVRLELKTSCPNGPCAYTLNGGPAGLTVDSRGVIVGTVTSPVQTFTGVTVTVTDNSGVTATSDPFTWTVTTDLLGRWTFDEDTGTTVADVSGGGHPATLSGRYERTAIAVQGPNAITTHGNAAATARGHVIDTSKSFTVSAWVKLADSEIKRDQTVISQDGRTVSGFSLGLRRETGSFGFSRYADDSDSKLFAANSSRSPQAGQWYQLAGVYDATAATLTLYVNGRRQETTDAPRGWNAPGDLVMGRGLDDGESVDWVNGTIDDVRAYSGALSSAAVAQLAEAGYWNLDEGAGSTARDGSLNNFDGKFTGDPIWTTGVIGPSAAQFDGSPGIIDTGAEVIDTAQSYSISAWAKLDAADKSNGIIASMDGRNVSGFRLQLIDGNWAMVAVTRDPQGNATVTAVRSPETVEPGQWYHVVGVYDSVADRPTLYVNGIEQGDAVDYATGWENSGRFVIGGGQATGSKDGSFNGAIDDVTAYRFRLGQAAITALADSAPPTPAAPSAKAGSGSATVSWLAPADIAGSPVTAYIVTPYLNGVAQKERTYKSDPTSQDLTLTPGGSYTFTVTAVNGNGSSDPSTRSAAVVPS